jgi:hypothetical protein
MGPTRPINMSPMMTTRPTGCRSGVMPVERPTVPNADTDSNRPSPSENPPEVNNTAEATVINPMASSTTVMARRWVESGTRRPKPLTSALPRSWLQMTMARIMKVDTLMPPEVPADPAPMNMRAMVASRLSGRIDPTSIVLNPAVRGVTDANPPFKNLSGSDMDPSVLVLVHSKVVSTTNPSTNSAAVPESVTLECRVSSRHRRPTRRRSTSTGKPSPPMMMEVIRGNKMSQSLEKRIIESG